MLCTMLFCSCFPLSRICTNLPVAALGEDPIRQWILTEGKATKITGVSSIGGGCINSAQCYKTDASSFFVKTNGCANFLFESMMSLELHD